MIPTRVNPLVASNAENSCSVRSRAPSVKSILTSVNFETGSSLGGPITCSMASSFAPGAIAVRQTRRIAVGSSVFQSCSEGPFAARSVSRFQAGRSSVLRSQRQFPRSPPTASGRALVHHRQRQAGRTRPASSPLVRFPRPTHPCRSDEIVAPDLARFSDAALRSPRCYRPRAAPATALGSRDRDRLGPASVIMAMSTPAMQRQTPRTARPMEKLLDCVRT